MCEGKRRRRGGFKCALCSRGVPVNHEGGLEAGRRGIGEGLKTGIGGERCRTAAEAGTREVGRRRREWEGEVMGFQQVVKTAAVCNFVL